MRIESFWVVIRPTPRASLADICFETTPTRLGADLDRRGLLGIDEVLAIFTDAAGAQEFAGGVLAEKRKAWAVLDAQLAQSAAARHRYP